MNERRERGYRLTAGNLIDYIKTEYGSDDVKMVKAKNVVGIEPLLQNDYGKPYDCALVSMTTLLNYELKGRQRIEMLYAYIEDIAKQFGYNGDTVGTSNVVVRSILGHAAKAFRVRKSACSRYIKQFGYNWKNLCNLIGAKTPVILCIPNDGRNYYTQHAVLVIGVVEYRLADKDDQRVRIIRIYDNWLKEVGFVDYDKLSQKSSIVYLK